MVAVIDSTDGLLSASDLDTLVEASNVFMHQHLAPALERQPWDVTIGGGAYVHSLLVPEDKDVPGALAFHELDKTGYPVMVTMVKTVLDYSGTMFGADGVLSAHLHELAETFYDPFCNAVAFDAAGWAWWRELCDAVQGQDFDLGGDAAGKYGPNFCLPHYFNPDSPDTNLDYQHNQQAPFTVGPQGYQVKRQCGAETQVSGRALPDLPAGAPVPRPDLTGRPGDVVDEPAPDVPVFDPTKPHCYGPDGQPRAGGPNAWRTLKITEVPPEGVAA